MTLFNTFRNSMILTGFLLVVNIFADDTMQNIAVERVTRNEVFIDGTTGEVLDNSKIVLIRNEPQNTTMAGTMRDYENITVDNNNEFKKLIYRLPGLNKLTGYSDTGTGEVYSDFPVRAREIKVMYSVTATSTDPNEASVIIHVAGNSITVPLNITQAPFSVTVTGIETYLNDETHNQFQAGCHPIHTPFTKGTSILTIQVNYLQIWLDGRNVFNSGHTLYNRAAPVIVCFWPAGTLVIHKNRETGGYTVIKKDEEGIVPANDFQIGLRDMINEQGKCYSQEAWVIPANGVAGLPEYPIPLTDPCRLEHSAKLEGPNGFQQQPAYVGVGDSLQLQARGTIHNPGDAHTVRLIGLFGQTPKDGSGVADLCNLGVFTGKNPGTVTVRLNNINDQYLATSGPIDVTVVKVDLDVDLKGDGKFSEDDPREKMSPGLVIPVNDNDTGAPAGADNANEVIDTAADKADMKTLKLCKLLPATLPGGTVKLMVSDKTKVRIFDEPGTALIGPASVESSCDIPLTLIKSRDLNYRVEGVAPGQVTALLKYTDPFGKDISDKVVLTVLKVDITEPNENDVFLHGDKALFKVEIDPILTVSSWHWEILEGEGSPSTSSTDTYEPVVRNADEDYDNPDIFKVKVTATVGGSECSDELQIKVVYPKIDVINFKSTKAVVHEGDWVTHDPEWTSTMTDESVSVFTRNTKIMADVTFKTKLPLTNPTEISRLYANVAWYVAGDCDLESKPTIQTVSGDSTVIAMEGASALIDEIYAYEESWLWTRNLKYEWFYEMADTDSEKHYIKPDPDDNRHDLYVTLADPVNDPVYETLLHITCNAARGESTAAGALNEIWDEFTDRDVRRKDAQQMTYYGSFKCQNVTTDSLIKNRDGQCGAWAQMFIDMLKHHGIDNANDYVQFLPSAADDQGFLVKNWTFNGLGSSGNPNYPYLNIPDWQPDGTFWDDTSYKWIYADVNDAQGIGGQGNANPASLFGNHQITLEGQYYDPSYGTKLSSLQEIDNDTIDGYFQIVPMVVDETQLGVDVNKDGDTTDVAVPVEVLLIRKNPAGLDLIRNPNWTNY